MPDRLGGGGSSGGGFLSKPINFVTELVWGFINFGKNSLLHVDF